MATWKEHRALVEQYADAAASGLPRTAAAIRAVLARLDAAEAALLALRVAGGAPSPAPGAVISREAMEAIVATGAYDALYAEQDKP